MGGVNNSASGNFSIVGGGCSNTASGYTASVGGGCANSATNSYSAVVGGASNNATGNMGMIWGGQSNCICSGAQWSTILGGRNNTVTANRAGSGGSYLTASTYGYFEFNAIDKVFGSFTITHPDPSKEANYQLWHSFVEAPTAGDNIYRYEITTINGTAILQLPDYYKFLNKNDQVWVTAKNHFGNAYGIVNNEQTCINFTSDTDGEYIVLLMGTRKDKWAQYAWNGVERYKTASKNSMSN
jgi:hypothetical protein